MDVYEKRLWALIGVTCALLAIAHRIRIWDDVTPT